MKVVSRILAAAPSLILILLVASVTQATSARPETHPPGLLAPTPRPTPITTRIPELNAPSRTGAPATYDVFIYSVSPAPPQCVYRAGEDQAARTLVIEGANFSTSVHNLQFLNVATGEQSIHFHQEANWESATRVTVDMNTIKHLLWSDPKVTLKARLTTYTGGTYGAVSDWSQEFYLADGAEACAAVGPTPPPDPQVTPPPTEYRVLEVIYNPILEAQGSQTLIGYMHWNDPIALDQQYMADLDIASRGAVIYQIVERRVVDDFPQKRDGFDYDDSSYLACLANTATCHQPDTVDYGKIFDDFDICSKVVADGISEVWIWGGPYFGYWEYSIRGPVVNITPENIPLCANKTVTVMGFNYERSNPEMIEDFGHRTEGVLAFEIADGNWQQNEANEWNKFSLVAAPVSAYTYGHCGNVHYPPNGVSDYDWSNPRQVSSDCDDWLNYPDLTNTFVPLSCMAWGCDGYHYKQWWLAHLPHAAGVTDGHLNDWWCYVMDYEAASVTPAQPSGLAGTAVGDDDVSLSWMLNGSSGYQVWEGHSPYFSPDDGQVGTQLLTITAKPPYLVANATGDPAVNHTYLVQGVNHCGHASIGASNRVGEFDFLLAPGSP